MTNLRGRITGRLEALRAAYPAGFAIGLHLGFAAPRYLFICYDARWVALYTQQGYVLRDPTIRWGIGNTGWVRWSQLDDPQGASVMRLAANHGLRYGFVAAHASEGSRSIGGFARSDREPEDAEMAAGAEALAELHRLTEGLDARSPSIHEGLRRLSAEFGRA